MGVVIELRKVPNTGTVVFRLFSKPRCLLTHWTDTGSVLCPGLDKCKKHDRPMLKGFSCAWEWVEKASAWVPVVMEWTESAIQTIGLDFSEGDVWEMSRMHTGKTPKQVVGHYLGVVPIAPGTKPWDVKSIVERFFRQHNAKWDISPDYMLRAEGEEDQSDRPPGIVPPIKADLERASPEVMLSFRERIKEARQGIEKKVN